MKEKTNAPISIRLSAESGVTKDHNLHAYVIGQGGKIIESVPFEGMVAKLKSTKTTIDGLSRIYIAQQLPKELAKKADERTLIKGGAFQVVKKFTKNVIDVTRIPIGVFRPWEPGNCLISGTVTNTITLDGEEVTGPVCHARVHLVEVEVEWVYRYLPIIYKLIPDGVINEISQKFKLLVPTPPIPDSIGPAALLEKISLPLSSLGQKGSVDEMVKIKALAPLPTNVMQGMTSNSLEVVRKTIADYHPILFPYFCLWPYFWYWLYEVNEDNIAYTDCDGNFEYWKNIATEDGLLNIYTWVEVEIGGQWVTVYRPFGIPCYTRWNYPCNTPVNIHLTDSRIAPCVCDPLVGDIVWVKRINSGTSVRNLALQASDLSKPSLFADARGLTNSVGIEGNNWVSPFTGSFPVIVQFGDGFPSTNIVYFRWKYTRITNAELQSVIPDPLNPVYNYQEGPLSKSYTYEGTDAEGNSVFYTGTFPLDVALGTGKVYKIPHVDASVDSGIATAEWNQDTITININTTGSANPVDNLQNGIYEFILELLDAAGNVVDVADEVFQIDSNLPSPPFGASTPAKAVDKDYAEINKNTGSVNGFSFLIRIDNDKTTCGIDNAEVLNGDGTTATTDTLCGFAEYKDKASGSMLLKFNARQPHRYAKYSFDAIRGNGNVTPAAALSGQVPEQHITVATTNGPVDCQVNPSLNDMLGPCTRGAFAENLYVAAYHTDGNTSLSNRYPNYDSSGQAAFAIEQQP